tara:strand:- start:231 stop:524 length:294 start_codon:yes stop_codon:yes gene_type:complete
MYLLATIKEIRKIFFLQEIQLITEKIKHLLLALIEDSSIHSDLFIVFSRTNLADNKSEHLRLFNIKQMDRRQERRIFSEKSSAFQINSNSSRCDSKV